MWKLQDPVPIVRLRLMVQSADSKFGIGTLCLSLPEALSGSAGLGTLRRRLRYVEVYGCSILTISRLSAFQSSSNGVVLGTPNKATITILSNDNAFGVIAFNSVRNVNQQQYFR